MPASANRVRWLKLAGQRKPNCPIPRYVVFLFNDNKDDKKKNRYVVSLLLNQG